VYIITIIPATAVTHTIYICYLYLYMYGVGILRCVLVDSRISLYLLCARTRLLFYCPRWAHMSAVYKNNIMVTSWIFIFIFFFLVGQYNVSIVSRCLLFFCHIVILLWKYAVNSTYVNLYTCFWKYHRPILLINFFFIIRLFIFDFWCSPWIFYDMMFSVLHFSRIMNEPIII